MNYAKIKPCDVANGPGVRVSLFVSGCDIHCKGCFNKQAWDYSYGQKFTTKTLNQIFDLLAPDYIRGFSVLGGEPLSERNAQTVLDICWSVREAYPDKTIWLYTGYDDYEIAYIWDELRAVVDVIVTGPFQEDLRDPNLRFRGSSNQRLTALSKRGREEFNRINGYSS